MAATRNDWRDGLYWLLCYSFFWYLLTGGAGIGFGIPAVLLAVATARGLELRPLYLRIWQLPRFLVFFGGAMTAGAWDVARRALHPRRPLRPAWGRYPLQSPDPSTQQLCSALVGLLPGTLVAYVDNNHMHVHLLDQSQPIAETLTQLENHLLRLLAAEQQR